LVRLAARQGYRRVSAHPRGGSNGVAFALGLATFAAIAIAGSGVGSALGASATSQSNCIAHHPQEYVGTRGCTGHDEPEIDPLSSRAGSAQDLT
jgi:hypothetical protein